MTKEQLIETAVKYVYREISEDVFLTAVDAYSSADNGAKPIVSGALPPDVTLKDIKEIRNYFGEHDATLFEHRAFSIISRLINHIEATGGNDR